MFDWHPNAPRGYDGRVASREEPIVRTPLAFAIAAGCWLALPAPGARGQPTAPAGTPHIDCKAMAGRPGSPMSLEQCERQLAVMQGLQQGMDASGAERPGDEQMTCDQIIAELKQQPVSGVTPANRAESAAAGAQLKGAIGAASGDAAAAMAAGTATTAAASGAALLPGGNAVAGAAMSTQMAQQQALIANNKPAIDAARGRAMAANANATMDVTAMMRAHPRFARLAQLAGAKGCSGDF